MNKQDVVYPYNGIQFSNIKEQTTDACYNMDESQNIIQKTTYFTIPFIRKVPKGHIYRDSKQISGCLELRGA